MSKTARLPLTSLFSAFERRLGETMTQNETLYQALEQIQQEWELTDAQMARLMHVDESTYSRWMQEGRTVENPPVVPLGMDTALPLVSIYKSLLRRFSDIEERVKWLFKENPDFGGNKPIDIATSSVENLFWVSYYLDSNRI
jgi:hypothetical protein